MDVIFTAFGKTPSEANVLSANLVAWLDKKEFQRCVLFIPNEKDYSDIQGELKSIFSEENVDVVELSQFDTTNLTSPQQLKDIPWNLIEEMKSKIDSATKSTVLLGRGTALHDHLLWFLSQCFDSFDAIHIDSLEPVLSLYDNLDLNSIAQSGIAGLLQKYLDDLNSNSTDFINCGQIHSDEISEIHGAAFKKGVRSNFTPFIENGLVSRFEVPGKTVTYKLNPKGLYPAIQSFFDTQETDVNQSTAGLTICCGRLPNIQTDDQSGNKNVQDFFEMISPLQPIDGLFAILQRHDDSIEGTHILTLQDAIAFFSDSSFLGDLRYVEATFTNRSRMDNIDMANHLIVINPQPTIEFQFEFVLKVFLECQLFEQKFGRRIWNIDITSPVNALRSAISFLAIATNSQPSYILKPPNSEIRKLRKTEFVLDVPNHVTYEMMKEFSNLHGNDKGSINCLVALLLYEDEKESSVVDELIPTSENDNFYVGVDEKDLKKFINNRTLQLPYDLKSGTSALYRKMEELHKQGLVSIHRSNVEGKKRKIYRYQLTDLGIFISKRVLEYKLAEQLR